MAFFPSLVFSLCGTKEQPLRRRCTHARHVAPMRVTSLSHACICRCIISGCHSEASFHHPQTDSPLSCALLPPRSFLALSHRFGPEGGVLGPESERELCEKLCCCEEVQHLGFSGSVVLGGPIGVLIAVCVPFNTCSQLGGHSNAASAW